MVFAKNILILQHRSGFTLNFNCVDALNLVNREAQDIKLSCAEEWCKGALQKSG